MLRLYRAEFSTNAERVALALAHKGLAVESVVIDYADRSEVERVSGQPLVPVLDDDGTIVVDSMAIVAYLEAKFPDPPLYPADEARRAEMEVFVDWFNRFWKGPPNEIEAEQATAEPDRERIARLSAEMAAPTTSAGRSCPTARSASRGPRTTRTKPTTPWLATPTLSRGPEPTRETGCRRTASAL